MEARGRNGWFKATRCLVRTAANLEGTETETRISFYSRQIGDMPPIMLIGTRQEMETMLEKPYMPFICIRMIAQKKLICREAEQNG